MYKFESSQKMKAEPSRRFLKPLAAKLETVLLNHVFFHT